ncbi:hypothetical protein [Burkholderia dolosa]|uniref:hypothetical protein n=1 Tax=Burkholderia dolosa TaxID=152500 RepID=UPI0027D2D45F|nr:hypothetical protein [Burkholderia dolosa]
MPLSLNTLFRMVKRWGLRAQYLRAVCGNLRASGRFCRAPQAGSPVRRFAGSPVRRSPFAFRLSPFAFRLSPFAFRLSPFAFRLSPFAFRLSPFAFRLSPFALLVTLCRARLNARSSSIPAPARDSVHHRRDTQLAQPTPPIKWSAERRAHLGTRHVAELALSG